MTAPRHPRPNPYERQAPPEPYRRPDHPEQGGPGPRHGHPEPDDPQQAYPAQGFDARFPDRGSPERGFPEQAFPEQRRRKQQYRDPNSGGHPHSPQARSAPPPQRQASATDPYAEQHGRHVLGPRNQGSPVPPYPEYSHPDHSYPDHSYPDHSHPEQGYRGQPGRMHEDRLPAHERSPRSDVAPVHPDRHRAHQQAPAQHREAPAPPASPAPADPAPPRRQRFGGLAWAALILGIVGVVGSPVIILNNVTAIAAVVGLVLGVIAVFGSRKVLSLIAVVLCVAALAFTLMAQNAAVAAFDRQLAGLTGDDPAAMQDVVARDCAIVDRGYGLVVAEGTIEITNSTEDPQTYTVTVSVNDDAGARIGEINAIANSLAPGQSVVLSGMDAPGTATEQAQPGPAACQAADVTRFGS